MNLIKGQIESFKMPNLNVEKLTIMAISELLNADIVINDLVRDLLKAG
jgi:hypothetical protein